MVTVFVSRCVTHDKSTFRDGGGLVDPALSAISKLNSQEKKTNALVHQVSYPTGWSHEVRGILFVEAICRNNQSFL